MTDEASPELSERILVNNQIKQFLLRLETTGLTDDNVKAILSNLNEHIDRVEEIKISGIKIKPRKDEEILFTDDSGYDYRCVLESQGLFLTLSPRMSYIAIEMKRYLSKASYTEMLEYLLSAIQKAGAQLTFRRIGMRFVNEFPCKMGKQIKSILEPMPSKVVNAMLESEGLTRAIAMQESIDAVSGCKSRVQYGVPNSFYPAVITTFDLLLDIDVYTHAVRTPEEVRTTADVLNHKAQSIFQKYVTEKYRNSMR